MTTNLVPNEVLQLPGGKGYDVNYSNPEDDKAFINWLQCYNKKGMHNLVDSNGRTMWFTGEAGALRPSKAKSRNIRKSSTVSVKKEEKDKGGGKKDVIDTPQDVGRDKTVCKLEVKEEGLGNKCCEGINKEKRGRGPTNSNGYHPGLGK